MRLLLLTTATAVVIPGMGFLAETIAPIGLAGETTLVGQGVVAAMLFWFMWRHEKNMAMLTRSIDRLVRENIMFVLSIPDIKPQLRREAEKLKADLPPDASQ